MMECKTDPLSYALLELERDGGGSGPGQQAERCAHAHLQALAKDHRIWHPQRSWAMCEKVDYCKGLGK
jgi:hypothetical protein